MTNGQIKGDGTSRLLKSYLPNTYDEFKALMESGQLPVDVLFNPSGWSTLPTFLNKETLLTDEAAVPFGFMNGATPNDIFNWFAQLHLYYWRIRGVSSYYSLIVSSSAISSSKILVTGIETTSNTYAEIVYSNSAYATSNGAIRLRNPKYIACYTDRRNISEVNELLTGKFFYCNGYYGGTYNGPSLDTTFYKMNDNSGSLYWSGSSLSVYGNGMYSVTSVLQSGLGQWTYESSENRNAYPDSGITDGKEYEYVGIPFDNIKKHIPEFTTLNYLGSGSYGSGNKNSFTVDFPIKCAMIYPINSATGLVYVYGQTAHTVTFTLSSDMKTLSWYGSSASEQCNTNGTKYVVAVWG